MLWCISVGQTIVFCRLPLRRPQEAMACATKQLVCRRRRPQEAMACATKQTGRWDPFLATHYTRALKPSKTVQRWLRGAWLAGLGLLVVGSLLPGSSPAVSWLSGVSDKLLHFVAYAALAVVAVAGAADRRVALRSVLIMVALGVLLDYLQRFVPGRGFELGDVAADNVGLLCGASLGLWLVR